MKNDFVHGMKRRAFVQLSNEDTMVDLATVSSGTGVV